MPRSLRLSVARELDRADRLDTVPGLAARLHQPSHRLALWATLPRSTVTADDVLLDLGSGKGRIVLQAARRYPLRRVVGIEHSPELTSVARFNLEATRTRLRCQDVELIVADVAGATIPSDVTLAYLYNPFAGRVFDCVVDRLSEMVQRRGRSLRIVYVNPVEHERLIRRRGVVELAPPARWRLRLAGLGADGARAYELLPGPAAEGFA